MMKTKKVLFSLLVAFLAVPALIAQTSDKNAVKVVNDMLNLVKTNAVKTNFTMTLKEPTSAQVQKTEGNFTMKSNKFILDMAEMNVFFDGTTQWAYASDLNEVSITNPTDKELAEINPMAILSAYQNKSVVKFAKSASKTAHAITLVPKDKKSDVKNILISVNKSNNYPLSIQLTNKKGAITTLVLTKFTTGLKINDSAFVFNPKKYKGIEINDLR